MRFTRRPRKGAVAVVLALALCGLLAVRAAGVTGTGSGLVIWGDAPQATHAPQTDAQAAQGQLQGRALPEKELLQPTLDPALPTFHPAYKRNKLKAELRCAASDVLPGLAKAWIAKLQEYYPKVNISVDPPYAGSLGALELIKGNLDCVFVSRELKPTDVSGFRSAFGYDPFSVPVSGGSYRHFGFLDSVAFAVNKDNPLEKLSFDQLDRILSTTDARGGAPIRTWGDLGLTGDWADKPIHIYGIKPWNGFEEFVRERVLSVNGRRGEWRGDASADPDVTFFPTVFKTASAIAADKYALGYTGMAYVDAPVKLLSLSQHDDSQAYSPSYENVARADYPLSRLIYLNTNNDPQRPESPALAELTRLILSRQGQQVVADQGIYLPLRYQQVVNSKALLDANP
jgi:phosphate transport system substrate-binding protein